MRLLGAKVSAVLLVGLIALLIILALTGAELAIVAAAMGKSDAVLGHIPLYLWSDAGWYLLTILSTLVVTLLFAMFVTMFVTVLSRSLAVGLVVALVYFFVENIVSGILRVVGSATGNNMWSDIPNYF